MFSIIDSIILGAVQGITEFLPISSSGHLIIARELLKIDQNGGLAFDAILQLATICAVTIYFRKDIIDLVKNILLGFKDSEKNKLTVYLIIATIPAVVLGVMFESLMETTFRNIPFIISTLLIGTLIMYGADLFFKKYKEKKNNSLFKSIVIGLFQSLALLPGMSRSGMTISGGYFMGLTKEESVRFSFLLAIPIITGSGLLQGINIIRNPNLISGNFISLGFGFISAFLFGWLAIDFLLKFLKTNNFKIFIWYRIALALILLSIF